MSDRPAFVIRNPQQGDVLTYEGQTWRSAPPDVPLLNELGAPSGSVNFNGQQAINFRIENRTADPGSPAVGQIWLRTDL